MRFSRIKLRLSIPHPDVGGGGHSHAVDMFATTGTDKVPAFQMETAGQHLVKLTGPTAVRYVNVNQLLWADVIEDDAKARAEQKTGKR